MAISNEQELQKALLSVLQDSMKALDKDNENTLKQAINEEVYDAGNPKGYQRTYQLRDASTSETTTLVDGGLSRVFVDANKMKSDMYHPHAYSFGDYQPKDYREYLAQTIIEGTSGDIFGNGFWQNKRDFISKAEEKFQKEYAQKLKAEMKKRGVNIK